MVFGRFNFWWRSQKKLGGWILVPEGALPFVCWESPSKGLLCDFIINLNSSNSCEYGSEFHLWLYIYTYIYMCVCVLLVCFILWDICITSYSLGKHAASCGHTPGAARRFGHRNLRQLRGEEVTVTWRRARPSKASQCARDEPKNGTWWTKPSGTFGSFVPAFFQANSGWNQCGLEDHGDIIENGDNTKSMEQLHHWHHWKRRFSVN